MVTATMPRTTDVAPVHIEDVAQVRSRISWGAVMAGSVLTLALYFLLTLLGGAIGFSISGATSAEGLSVGAAVWAITVTGLCLFVGGFVASQLTVGENRAEAALYGLLVWAVVFAVLVWLMATGVRAGFNAMVGVATAGAVTVAAADKATPGDWEAVAGKAGFTPQQIYEVKQKAKDVPAQAKQAADTLATKQKAEEVARAAGEGATRVTWLAFAGTLLSMLAAVIGGRVGAGPSFRLFAVHAGPARRM